MAKKNARVPKRIAGLKIPKRLRRALRPAAKFLSTDFGRNVAADVLVALAVALASTDAMRDAFRAAGKRSRKSGGGFADLALHLGQAAVLPALVALHAKLPGEVRAEQHARQKREDNRRAQAVH
ncbi:MAG TPA: hypothetical protein VEF55_06285 [Candidatus Binatia bacterium]|nr:hypothetical protein [Candidatus Binatia bacterium]